MFVHRSSTLQLIDDHLLPSSSFCAIWLHPVAVDRQAMKNARAR